MTRLAACFVLAACASTPKPTADDTQTAPDDTGPPGLLDNFGVEETEGAAGCDNVLPDDCLYPYPSDAFRQDGPDGPRLVLPPAGMPQGADALFSTAAFERFGDYGTATPLLFRLPGAVLPEGMGPFHSERSLEDDSPTVLVDVRTGERIPHWVETDYLAPDVDPPVFVVRPAVPLPRGSTVAFGIRGWTSGDGDPVASPEPFAALRDATASRWRGVHARRAFYEDSVFGPLTRAGVERDELQLAWAFSIRDAEAATASMLAVRDTIFDALPDGGPQITVDELLVCDGEADPAGCHPSIRVILDGTVEIPSVLEPPDRLGVRPLRRDDAGALVVDGVERRAFRLQLPHSAFEGQDPVPVLQYGHGFLGSRAEANNDWLRRMADRLGFAILATDMQGMSDPDIIIWTSVLLSDGGRFPELVDQPLQGVTNQLVMQRMVSTSLTDLDEPALRREDDGLAWDPDTVWYYGNSQGGSVGTIVMGTSLDATRGVLGVPGSGYPFLLHRSTVFTPLADVLAIAYPDAGAVTRFLALLGTGWDDFDPLTFAPYLHGDPLPGTPDHEVLLHVAKEDQQVHNEASFILGRASGAVLMTPAVRPVFGLPEQPYPASPGAAVVEVDFSVPDDPTPLDPADGDPSLPNEGDTHGWLRAWPPGQDQLVRFLRTGEVVDVCDGEACVADGKP